MTYASFGTWGVISNVFCEQVSMINVFLLVFRYSLSVLIVYGRRTVTFVSSVYASLAEHKDLHSATHCICVAHIILTKNSDCLPKRHLPIDLAACYL
jgi:hypothetical protein